MIGQTISHYKILEKLGEGGMGVVYKAEDTKLRRAVALKFLTPEMTRDKVAKSRFIQEAQAASALDHPNIAVVHEIDDTDDGRSFICMAYYDGKTLKDEIESGPFDVNRAIRIAIQIADGLQRAHEARIVHRDIKPANIILTGRNEVKIVDFGVAKLSTQTKGTSSTTGGTAAYMSPEQAQGADVDARSDLFSLGVVMYEMVTGKRPFIADHEAALMYSIVNIDPPSPSLIRREVPKGLEAIILKLLDKAPSRRYQNAAQLRTELKHIIGLTDSTRAVAVPPKVILDKRWFIPSALVVLIGSLLIFPPTRKLAERFSGFTTLPSVKAVAVLPFTVIGSDSINQVFSDGLMEILTSKLTELHLANETFTVKSSAEVRSRKVTTPSQAGEVLQATMAVTGSVQREQDRVLVVFNLVDTKTRNQIDSRVVEYSLTKLSEMQNKAVLDLISMIDVEPEEKFIKAALTGNTHDSRAYDFYVQARGYLLNYQKLTNIDNAIQLFQRALKEDSSFALAHAALGEAYWRKYDITKDKQWIDPAIKNAEKAIKFDDQLAQVYLTLGLIQKGTGKYEQAIVSLQRAIEIDSLSSDAYRELAGVYVSQGSLASAESMFRKALSLRPSYWANYSDLGSLFHRQKQYDKAAEQFKLVIEVAPDNPRGYSGLGACYFRMERRAEAFQLLEKSVKVDTTYYPGFSNLATNYFFDRAYADAARNFEKALAINSHDYKVWGNFASALYWSGQHEKAREKFQVAAKMAEDQLKVNTRDATVLSQLADYHSMLGNKKLALDYLKRSLTIGPDFVDIIRRSGDVYEQLGQRVQALKQIELALRKGTPVDELERAPALKELRSDPKYKSLIDKVGKKP